MNFGWSFQAFVTIGMNPSDRMIPAKEKETILSLLYGISESKNMDAI